MQYYRHLASFNLGKCNENLSISRKILSLLEKATKAKVNSVKKVVCLSRAIDDGTIHKQPFITSAIAGIDSLFGQWDGVPADCSLFDDFSALHEDFEEEIRQASLVSRFEHVIVRAPAIVQAARPGAIDNLIVFNERTYEQNPSLMKGLLESTSSSSLSISALDLAEAVVQSLLIDTIESLTFTVCTSPASAINLYSRVPRANYYGILYLDREVDELTDINEKDKTKLAEIDSEEVYSSMRSTYMIRPAESYLSQMEEDIAVEKFWTSMLKTLPKTLM